MSVSVRDGIGSRYPHGATLFAENSVIGRAIAKMKFNFAPQAMAA